MKKCYSLLALFVVLCLFANAQFTNSGNTVQGNDFYINYFGNGVSESNPLNTSSEISYTSQSQKLKHADFRNYSQLLAGVPSTGNEYDVKYYRIELRVNPDTTAGNYVRGKVTTYFTTTQAALTSLNFDMASSLNADSVYYHGVKVIAGNINRATTDLIKITVPAIAAIGTLDSVSIYYKGVPPVVAPTFPGTGYVTKKHNTTQNYIYTLSEPYSAYSWWPCKSYVVKDKADSMDMIVSAPNTFKVASNGALISEIPSGSSIITTWKERYPISAYQVCIGVANYVQYPTTPTMVNISGTMMPVYNWIFPETNTAAAHTSLDRVPLMITTYSSLYGDYPFKNEKYGNYSFGFGGGMEHNTFSGESTTGVYQNATDWDILAHELAHQWWGANVTNASWHDIWLHESFADYSEALLLEFAPSIATSVGQTAVGWRTTKKSNTLGATAQTTYVTDTSSINTIFSPSVYIYDRGGMIITMMRTMMGDAKFFQALKNYQSDPTIALGNAFTADLKRNLENASGITMTTFFNNWLYNTGYARYTGVAGAVCDWNNSGNDLAIKLVQKTQSSGITHFDMPVVVRIQGSNPLTMDTTVIIYDQGGILQKDINGVMTSAGSNTIYYHLSFAPVTLTFDPFVQTLASGAFGAKNPAVPVSLLATNVISFTGAKVGNTAKLSWSIDNSYDYATFDVERSADGISFENIGTLKAVDNPNSYSFSFSDYSLLTGMNYYRIKITDKNGAVVYTKTISISNKLDGYFTISPNPAKDYILISASGVKEKVDIKIFDASGRMVKNIFNQSFLTNNALKVSVEDMIAGMYFIEIQIPSVDNYIKQISVIR